ncbi:hypothetical protein VNO78_22178 [Psophocarpus tetragonolobus]|uniref:Uncharacterized protein n=1 Tax=Psophocarpus tetragonolobus TaxID=3891 RepID=A0AAN9SEH4_PSOTE
MDLWCLCSLESFLYYRHLSLGSLSVCMMHPHHTDTIVPFLVDSFTKHTFLVVRELSVYKILPHITFSDYKFGDKSCRIWRQHRGEKSSHVVTIEIRKHKRGRHVEIDDYVVVFVGGGVVRPRISEGQWRRHYVVFDCGAERGELVVEATKIVERKD